MHRYFQMVYYEILYAIEGSSYIKLVDTLPKLVYSPSHSSHVDCIGLVHMWSKGRGR